MALGGHRAGDGAVMFSAAPSERQIEIRQAWPQDQAFVAATFREQLARRHDGVTIRYRNADRIVDQILDSERTRVLVAVDGRRLIGWLAYVEMPRVRALLFAYVRRDDRLQGVARMLADAAWPRKTGSWVHAGLRGGSTRSLLQRYDGAIEMGLEELL